MLNIYLSNVTNYSERYASFINEYFVAFVSALSSCPDFRFCFADSELKALNKRNMLISDLHINTAFYNDEENSINIYYFANQDGLIKTLCENIRVSMLASGVVLKKIKINVIDNSNRIDIDNKPEISIEYKINENNINWLFNATILNIWTNAICDPLIKMANKFKRNPNILIKNGSQAICLFKDDDKMGNIDAMATIIKKYQAGTGLLASVSLGQFIYETFFGKSELIKNANNCFGMKANISYNSWYGSCWNGEKYTKSSIEAGNNGETPYVVSDFRKYPNIESSVVDHCSYLLYAKSGNSFRYAGINKTKNYEDACLCLNKGSYSTFVTYA